MSDSHKYLISLEHYQAFGAITFLYTRAETGIKMVLAGLLDIDLSTAMILSAPYCSDDLRYVVKGLSKMPNSRLSQKQREKLINLIGRFKSHGPLRNHIAHNPWTKGARPDSIKPMFIEIRKPTPKHIGMNPEETDYTLDELNRRCQDLVGLDSKINEFLKETGFEDDIWRNINALGPKIL